ncbi:MAG TPA: class I SAM-dependent methyltransferase [Gaiellaceae bacterium]|nr:class I SAM-dependent methyltransferase [Gaiellaceae bacterium]
MSDRARSFEGAAAEYERHRPDYPEAALRWALERLELGPGARVLDLGAGTGKLARGLVALGLDVVAVEPGAPMLEQLRAVLPQVEALDGAAEAIPLGDASVDGAVAGQAYHWFDAVRAVPELHRVVRPRGGLALFWNWWDLRDPLQAELGELLGIGAEREFADLPGAPWFREVDRDAIESVTETTPEQIVAREATTSAMLTADPRERERLLAEVHSIASRYGDRISMPQLTYVLAFARLS